MHLTWDKRFSGHHLLCGSSQEVNHCEEWKKWDYLHLPFPINGFDFIAETTAKSLCELFFISFLHIRQARQPGSSFNSRLESQMQLQIKLSSLVLSISDWWPIRIRRYFLSVTPTLPLSHHLFWWSIHRFANPSGTLWISFSPGESIERSKIQNSFTSASDHERNKSIKQTHFWCYGLSVAQF